MRLLLFVYIFDDVESAKALSNNNFIIIYRLLLYTHTQEYTTCNLVISPSPLLYTLV
jgi:hypothetical protein